MYQLTTMATESPDSVRKVVILLKHTGDALILKQNKFKFVFLHNSFAPNPDESVIDLYDNFGFDGKLVVNYANTMAWG